MINRPMMKTPIRVPAISPKVKFNIPTTLLLSSHRPQVKKL